MEVSLRMVLTAQGMISSSMFGHSIPTNSMIECSHLCFQNKSCSAFFSDDISKRCFLFDELQNMTAMEMHPLFQNNKYYEVQSDHCNNSYTYSRGLDLCYKVFSARISWSSARDNCNNDGAHLIRVESDVVNELMFQEAKLAGTSLWTGGRGSSVNQFVWQDGDIVQMTFWKPNQPDGDTESCIIIKHTENVASTSWHDLGCSAFEGYVCQKDLNVTGC